MKKIDVFLEELVQKGTGIYQEMIATRFGKFAVAFVFIAFCLFLLYQIYIEIISGYFW